MLSLDNGESVDTFKGDEKPFMAYCNPIGVRNTSTYVLSKTENVTLFFHCRCSRTVAGTSKCAKYVLYSGVDWFILNRVIDALVQQDVLTWNGLDQAFQTICLIVKMKVMYLPKVHALKVGNVDCLLIAKPVAINHLRIRHDCAKEKFLMLVVW